MKVKRITTVLLAAITATTAFAHTPSTANAGSALSTADVSAALAGVSDRLATPVDGASDADSIADNGTVDVRRDGTIHVRTKNAGDVVITLPYATKVEATNGGATYRSSNSATVTRLSGAGAQTLLVAANEDAPTEYPFDVSNGYVSESSAGGLVLLDRNGSPVVPISAPWAEDAKGQAVPTSFIVNADRTGFTQVVKHHVGVRYPVVADPYVSHTPLLWWPSNVKFGDRWTVYFNRSETGAIASAGAAAAIGLLRKTSIPGWIVGSAAAGIGWKAGEAASQSGKCVTLQVDLLWGWLLNISAFVRNC